MRIQTKGVQDLAIGGIARHADPDLIPRIKQRAERQQKRAAGPRCQDHPRRIKIDPVPIRIETRDFLPKFRQAQGYSIAKRIVIQHSGQSLSRAAGRRGRGLAHLHMDDVATGLFGLAGGLHHIHNNKGINLATA